MSSKWMLYVTMMSLILTTLLLHEAKAEGDENENEAMIKGEDDFKELTDSKSAFVMFFAPWCGHCSRLKPAWDQLTKDINSDETIPMVITKVDCTKNTKLCSDEGVMGYPTLKLYRVGEEAVRHKGGRDVVSLKKFVMEHVEGGDKADAGGADDGEDDGSASTHVDGLFDLTNDNFNAHVKSGYHFVKFYAPWCGHCRRLEPAWKDLAKLFEPKDDKPKVTIGRVDCTSNKAICTQHSVRGYPTLLMLKDGEKVADYESGRDLNSLEAFVKKSIGEGVEEKAKNVEDDDADDGGDVDTGSFDLTTDSFKKHVKSGYHFVKFYAPWCGHCRKLEPTWAELAKLYANNKDVGISRIDCTEHQPICGEYEVRGYPTLLLLKDSKLVEKYKGSRDLNAFKKFLGEKTGAEDADQDEKAEEDEEDENESGLYQLTSSTFHQHVATGSHFVKFYAPWCGHCKRLEPTWDLLAEVYKGSKDVTIAKIDCTASGEVCSSFEVRGYPTLLFIKDGKTLEKYRGARDLPSFQDFIKSKLSGEIDPAAAASGEKKASGGHVKGLFDLTGDSFEQHVSSGYHFVKFYAPWCGHCKRLEPTWAELAKLHKPVSDKPDVTIARIDCTANQATCSKYEVRGYPSLLLFKDGEKIAKYQGSRELNKLDEYLKAEMSGAKAEDADVKGVLYLHASNFEFSTATDATFVMFYAPWCGFCKKLKPVWMDVATSDFSAVKTPVKIANVDCTKNAPLCAEYQVTGYPTLILFVEGQARSKYVGSREKDALVKYVVDELSKPDPEPVVEEEEEKKEPEQKQEDEKIRDEL